MNTTKLKLDRLSFKHTSVALFIMNQDVWRRNGIRSAMELENEMIEMADRYSLDQSCLNYATGGYILSFSHYDDKCICSASVTGHMAYSYIKELQKLTCPSS